MSSEIYTWWATLQENLGNIDLYLGGHDIYIQLIRVKMMKRVFMMDRILFVLPLQSCRTIQVQSPSPQCFLTSPEVHISSYTASPDKTAKYHIQIQLKISNQNKCGYLKNKKRDVCCQWELKKNPLYFITKFKPYSKGIIK